MVQWIPSDCIYKLTHNFNFNIQLPLLKRAGKDLFLGLLTRIIALMDSSHNFAKAKRLWTNDGDFRKSKKNVIHGLRWLYFTSQVLKTGTISDYTAGNKEWQEVSIGRYINSQLTSCLDYGVYG